MKLKNLILLLLLQLMLVTCSKQDDEDYSIPEISTMEVSEITNTTAICGGNLISDGEYQIKGKGLVWHTSANASLELNSGITIEVDGVTKFSSTLIGLTTDTRYFVRAYATNDLGTGYGQEREFTTTILDNIEMIFVQGGTFEMGSEDSYSEEGYNDENPMHLVTLSSFEMGKYEVTQGQWKKVMGSNPSHLKGDLLPVDRVSWDDVQIFITKLNEQTGLEYRLPTEAEWEFAARGGMEENSTVYAGSNTIEDVTWFDGNSGNVSHNVGGKQANELGIFDMSGNVYEWCKDWYSISYYSDSPSDNPQGPSTGFYRVFRGGSWYNIDDHCRVAHRNAYYSNSRNYYLGFRLARSL